VAASGGRAALDAHGIDAAATAIGVIEAALEQVVVFGSIPVEPRLDHLGVLAGDRIGRIDVGGVESLSSRLATAIPGLVWAAIARDAGLVAARLAALLTPGRDADQAGLTVALDRIVQRLDDDDQLRAAPARLLDAGLAAARASGHDVPADVLALGRWLAAMADAAAVIDPALDIGDVARRFMLRRELEAAIALPDSLEAARRVLAVVAPLETLPGRLDRLMADRTASLRGRSRVAPGPGPAGGGRHRMDGHRAAAARRGRPAGRPAAHRTDGAAVGRRGRGGRIVPAVVEANRMTSLGQTIRVTERLTSATVTALLRAAALALDGARQPGDGGLSPAVLARLQRDAGEARAVYDTLAEAKGLSGALQAVAVIARDGSERILAIAALVELLADEAERRGGTRRGRGAYKRQQVKAALLYAVRRGGYTIPLVPSFLEPVIFSVGADLLIDFTVGHLNAQRL
jgi:hypothetical protein